MKDGSSTVARAASGDLAQLDLSSSAGPSSTRTEQWWTSRNKSRGLLLLLLRPHPSPRLKVVPGGKRKTSRNVQSKYILHLLSLSFFYCYLLQGKIAQFGNLSGLVEKVSWKYYDVRIREKYSSNAIFVSLVVWGIILHLSV
jgi:hypothetical protein